MGESDSGHLQQDIQILYREYEDLFEVTTHMKPMGDRVEQLFQTLISPKGRVYFTDKLVEEFL